MGDMKDMSAFMTLVNAKLKDEPQTLSKILQYLNSLSEGQKQSMKLEEFNLALVTPNSADQVDEMDEGDLPLKKLIPTLAKVVAMMNAPKPQSTQLGAASRSSGVAVRPDRLPKQITFPYSRHSSYSELCLLLEAFKPKDVFPCTVDETEWDAAYSMSSLFGHIYEKGQLFRHDCSMLSKLGFRMASREKITRAASQTTPSRQSIPARAGMKRSAREAEADGARNGLARNGLSPSARSRLALRREVHSSVTGNGASEWSRSGLSSTSGHVEGEEEL